MELFEECKRLQVTRIFTSYLLRKYLFVSLIPGKFVLCYNIHILGYIIFTCWNIRKSHNSFGEAKNMFK